MHIFKTILLTVFFILLTWGVSRAVTVSGKVIDPESNKPEGGVVTGIEELNLITETDNHGIFLFNDIPEGKYTLYFSHKNYGTEKINIKAKRDFFIEKRLERKVYNTGDKQILYSSFPETGSRHSITRDNIKDYPMRGMGDTSHLLQTLPGIGGGFSLATVPIIRGNNPLYNKYYIDDIPVDYPFHYIAAFIPLFSGLNEESVDEIIVIKGNSPVSTGDNLGNVINIKTRTAEQDGAHARLIFDPVLPLMPTFAFTVIPYKDISIVGSIRRSDIDWFIDTEDSNIYFQDYFFKVEYNHFNKHRFTFLAHGSNDEMDYEEYTARSGYSIFGLKWEYLISKNLLLKTVLSRYRMEQYLKNTQVYTDRVGAYVRIYPEQERLFQEFSFTEKKYYLKAGYEYVNHKNGCEANIALADIANIDFLEQTSTDLTVYFPVEGKSYSVFIQGGFENSIGWINLGIKHEKYGPLDNKSNSYSADAGYFVNNNTTVYLKHSVNYAHPDIYYYPGEPDPDFEDAKAINWAAGSDYKLSNKILLNAELYYSRYKNLNSDILYSVSDEFYKKFAQLHPFSEECEGKTYGGELYVKWMWRSLSGRTSYSCSVSKRSNDSLDDFYSDFDQTHLFRFLISWNWGKWIFSSIWHMYSSLPYTPVAGSNGSGEDYTAYYGERNSERFGMHHRLDLKALYKWEDGKRFYVEVWNALINQTNTIFEYFDNDEPYSSGNPENFNDLPFFIWAGFELCI
ncbi:MAG: carboxypeptidase-like regulatory domain-containing protein [Spirochaetes bacterium]|nr:carboxypeptidase-like regulatory domain-containing protein [Spirochaetota bacterium]